jgi:hypothetical protein
MNASRDHVGVGRVLAAAPAGGQAAADLVDRDDEVALGVERVLGSDVGGAPNLVRPRVPGRDQDRVVAGRVELAPRCHRQPAVRDVAALLEVERSDADQLIAAVVLGGVERVGDHAGAVRRRQFLRDGAQRVRGRGGERCRTALLIGVDRETALLLGVHRESPDPVVAGRMPRERPSASHQLQSQCANVYKFH